MSVEQYQNNAATTLNGAINNSVTSVVVTDGSVFPSSGDFRIICENEIMLCTARSTNTLTVTRGIEGTTAASHVDTTAIRHGLTSAGFLKLTADGMSRGTYANLPSAGRAGRRYICTDNPYIYYDNGSSWIPLLSDCPLDMNPNLADFSTWVNQDSFTLDTAAGYQRLWKVGGAASSEKMHCRVKSVGGLTTWTMRLIWDAFSPPGSNWFTGVCIRESSSGKIMGMGFNGGSSASAPSIIASTWSSATAFNSSIFSKAWWGNQGPWFLQIRADGTNFYFEYSTNRGITWLEMARLTISGSYLSGYDQAGFFGNNFSQDNSNQTFEMSVYHALFG